MKNGVKYLVLLSNLSMERVQTEKEIIHFCRETLAGFKLPRKVVFSSLPKRQRVKSKNLN